MIKIWERMLNNRNSLMNALVLMFSITMITMAIYQLVQINELFKKGKLLADVWDRIIVFIFALISNPFSFMLGYYFRTQGAPNEFEKLIEKTISGKDEKQTEVVKKTVELIEEKEVNS